MATTHAGGRAPGPDIHGQGRLALSLAVDWVARTATHHRHGPALAFPLGAVLGGERDSIRGGVAERQPVAAPGAGLLEHYPRCVGYLRLLRHASHAPGAQRVLPLQR